MRCKLTLVMLLCSLTAFSGPLPYKVVAGGGLNMRATPGTAGIIVILVPD